MYLVGLFALISYANNYFKSMAAYTSSASYHLSMFFIFFVLTFFITFPLIKIYLISSNLIFAGTQRTRPYKLTAMPVIVHCIGVTLSVLLKVGIQLMSFVLSYFNCWLFAHLFLADSFFVGYRRESPSRYVPHRQVSVLFIPSIRHTLKGHNFIFLFCIPQGAFVAVPG